MFYEAQGRSYQLLSIKNMLAYMVMWSMGIYESWLIGRSFKPNSVYG